MTAVVWFGPTSAQMKYLQPTDLNPAWLNDKYNQAYHDEKSMFELLHTQANWQLSPRIKPPAWRAQTKPEKKFNDDIRFPADRVKGPSHSAG